MVLYLTLRISGSTMESSQSLLRHLCLGIVWPPSATMSSIAFIPSVRVGILSMVMINMMAILWHNLEKSAPFSVQYA